ARPPEARTGACGVARRCARISATLSIGSQPSQIPPPTLWQARCNRPVSILTEGLMKTRIVIVGGGFAGLYAAMYLDKTVAPRSEAEVMLISRENFIVFMPMLHEVAAGDLHPGDIVNPLRRILRHVNVVQAEVDAIDLRARTVSCVAGLRDVRREFEFDHPLLALGSEPDFFEMAGVRDGTLTMKSLSDAARLHNTMVALLETAALQPDEVARRQLLTFVTAGGGFAGVETTGAVHDFIREAGRFYP